MDIFKLIAVVIAGALWSAFLVAFLHKKDVHPIREILDRFSRLGWLCKVGVLFLVVQLTMFGGAKHGGTNDVDDVTGTNDVEIVEGGETNEVGGASGEADYSPLQLMMLPPLTSGQESASPLSVADIDRGYRLESVTTNPAISYAMPSEGEVRGTWHLTGAYEDVQKVALDGFAFPLGTNRCDSLWAYTWGKVRPQLKNVTNEIAATGVPMSAIPDVSRFWTAMTSSNTYLLTWEDFAAGRQSLTTNNQQLTTVSAQIELYPTGDFITRSNEVETVWQRINPDDWDDDGIPNEEDDEPFVRAVETQFGPHQEVPEGDDPDHYCWVDIVVRQANARVQFVGGGGSWLPDPNFIAEANATNRVMILIGKTYAVHCSMPVDVIAKSDEDIDTWMDEGVLMIEWPVWFEYVNVGPLLMASPLLGSGSSGNGTTVRVHPTRMRGGDYSWTDNYCCYSFAADGTPVFNCDGTCGCGGCYTGEVTYDCSGHEFSFGGWSCGCGSGDDDDPHGGDEPEDPPPTRGVSVRFSHSAVIFEDAYESEPNVTVPRRSTDVELTCSANGGPNGGTYSFEVENEDKLIRKSGSYLPRSGTLRPNETFKFKVRYEAQEASGSVGDIKAKANFTDAVDGALPVVQSELTAVEVELTNEIDAPANTNSHRHQYGVCEMVNCSILPSGSAQKIALNGASVEQSGKFRCPIHASTNPFEIRAGGASYVPSVSVIEPADIEAVNVYLLTYGVPLWCAGGVGLQMQFRVLPLTVSFSEIAVEEVPSDQGYPLGYFAHPFFDRERSHTRQCGAGVWGNVDANNIVSGIDSTGLVDALPRMTSSYEIVDDPTVGWVSGTRTWALPFGWNTKGTTGETAPYCQFAAGKSIVFTIDEFGTATVTKLGYTATRSIDGLTSLVGE